MEINVYLEIPKNSAVKYEYDFKLDKTVEDFVFKDGFLYKYNYGFMPNTLAEDGDPLDIIVYDDEQLTRDHLYTVRPVGIIKLLDRGVGDPKIIAVPSGSDIKTMEHLGDKEKLIKEFSEFFDVIAKQKNKTMEIQQVLGEDDAVAEIKSSLDRFGNKN